MDVISGTVLLVFSLASVAFASPDPAYGSAIRDDDGKLSDGIRTHLSPERKKLVLIHAVFGTLAWLVFAPIAIISARYFKSRFRDVDGRMWFRVHFSFNSMTVILMILTFVIGYYAVVPGSVHQFANPHLHIGTAIFAAVCIQALLGIVNHYILRPMRRHRDPPRTPFTNKLHILLGWVTWALGVSNIPIGMILYGSPTRLFTFYGVYLVALILLLGFLEAAYGRDGGRRAGFDEEKRFPFQRGVRMRERSIPSSESVLPVAGVAPGEEEVVTTVPVAEAQERDLQRVHTAPQAPNPAQAAAVKALTGRNLAETEATATASQTREQPALKDVPAKQPTIEEPVVEQPAGEVAEKVEDKPKDPPAKGVVRV
ncbi:hypothetical protein ABW19_dt0203946 [Dactylella cylindrospora]|nr:hypothetical protein ABW19_dt0203946 [Dactylella cylindrospora]